MYISVKNILTQIEYAASKSEMDVLLMHGSFDLTESEVQHKVMIVKGEQLASQQEKIEQPE